MKTMNDLLWSFWTAFIILQLYTLGLSVSVIMTMDSIKEHMGLVIAPVFLLSNLVLLCVVGQNVKDSVAEVQDAAYNCEWYSAPIPFRKLILMLLIRCGRESKLEAKPFFEMDFVLLMKVLNSAYAIMAIVLNVSK